MSDTDDTTLSNFESLLAGFRRNIDEVDGKLVALLNERAGFVQQVGALKHKHKPGECPIRPGREAEQIRKIVEAFKDGPFPKAAAAHIWRLIIAGSTSLEAELKLSVHAPDKELGYCWLGSEYFGSFTQQIRQPSAKRVLGDIMDKKATIGIVPTPRTDDEAPWWIDLAQWIDRAPPENLKPQIFAMLPCVLPEKQTAGMLTALAIACVEPEETGNDMTYLALNAEENISLHKLQTLFAQEKCDAKWINVVAAVPGRRHHLVEVKGFLTPDSAMSVKLLAAMPPGTVKVHFLGSYATPPVLSAQKAPAYAEPTDA